MITWLMNKLFFNPKQHPAQKQPVDQTPLDWNGLLKRFSYPKNNDFVVRELDVPGGGGGGGGGGEG